MKHKSTTMKYLIPVLLISILTSCSVSKEIKQTRPQVIHQINETTFIIGGNARHFQERKDWKDRRAAKNADKQTYTAKN